MSCHDIERAETMRVQRDNALARAQAAEFREKRLRLQHDRLESQAFALMLAAIVGALVFVAVVLREVLP